MLALKFGNFIFLQSSLGHGDSKGALGFKIGPQIRLRQRCTRIHELRFIMQIITTFGMLKLYLVKVCFLNIMKKNEEILLVKNQFQKEILRQAELVICISIHMFSIHMFHFKFVIDAFNWKYSYVWELSTKYLTFREIESYLCFNFNFKF